MSDSAESDRPTAPSYRRAEFMTSASKLSQCPPDSGWEVAFAGRSNAGKSSAINSLTGNKKLAKTSKTPGRTQLINFFQLTPNQRLVDLPGYGFAKVPLAVKREWTRQLESYLQKRQSLRGLIPDILLLVFEPFGEDIDASVREFGRLLEEVFQTGCHLGAAGRHFSAGEPLPPLVPWHQPVFAQG